MGGSRTRLGALAGLLLQLLEGRALAEPPAARALFGTGLGSRSGGCLRGALVGHVRHGFGDKDTGAEAKNGQDGCNRGEKLHHVLQC